MTPKTTYTPWLAYGRAGALDHGTVTGTTTLCGKGIAGQDVAVRFNPESAFACKRCAANLARKATGVDNG